MAAHLSTSTPWSWHSESTPAKTAVERVYAIVSGDIVDGTLPGGSLITEGEVAQRMSVSRTPVREAFLLMESHGLLQLYPKKGALVTSTNPTETAALLQARIMLESRAVALQPKTAALNHTLMDDLAGILKLQRTAAAHADIPALARADHQFHARVIAASGNPIIDDFYAQLGPRLARLTCQTVRTNTAQLQRFVDEHASLAELLANGDHQGYETLLRQHVAIS